MKEFLDLFRRTIIGRQRGDTQSGGGVAGIRGGVATAIIISDVK
jgi:hypothetical protein